MIGIKDEIKMDDLPEPYDSIACEIGIENTLKLAKLFSGEQVYFPTYDAVERPIRNRKIKAEFNGYNFKYLAHKYEITERTVRDIVSDIISQKQNEPNKEQISFFDLDV